MWQKRYQTGKKKKTHTLLYGAFKGKISKKVNLKKNNRGV